MTSGTFDRVRSDAIDRGVALVNYGLLFMAVFFCGVPALIAVVLAYARRREALPAVRGHYGFQIRIFWTALLLTLIAVGCAIAAAFVMLGGLVRGSLGDVWDTIAFDVSDTSLKVSAPLVILAVVGALAWCLTCLWLLAASAVGFIRLASDRSMGQVARP